jgi:hypothetical protein
MGRQKKSQAWMFDPTIPTPKKKRRKIPKELQGKKRVKGPGTDYTHVSVFQGGAPGSGKRR